MKRKLLYLPSVSNLHLHRFLTLLIGKYQSFFAWTLALIIFGLLPFILRDQHFGYLLLKLFMCRQWTHADLSSSSFFRQHLRLQPSQLRILDLHGCIETVIFRFSILGNQISTSSSCSQIFKNEFFVKPQVVLRRLTSNQSSQLATMFQGSILLLGTFLECRSFDQFLMHLE